MPKIKGKAVSVLQLLVALCIALLGVGLLTQSAAVSGGIRRGLEVSAGVLIPSLFPFMVLSGYISMSGYARILSAPLGLLTTRIYKLPKELGVVILLSLIGGYPVGAKMIANLLEQKRIDRETAERMLCFCVNSGPSFLITAVGTGLLMSRVAGIVLFATQTLATLLIGWVASLRVQRPRDAGRQYVGVGGPAAFVAAVSGATNAMIAMCSFAVLCSGLLSMVGASGFMAWLSGVLPVSERMVAAVVSGFFEVTSGCIAAAGLGGEQAFALTSVFVSFCGLSVIFQIMSCFAGGVVSFRKFIVSRFVHCFLSTAMALPIYTRLCADQAVWLPVTPPTMHTDSKTILISVCLLGMCTIFMLSLNTTQNGK